ncbi:protein phosphatase 2C domain-containing protein [Algibacter mikhailovii]|uniref:PPM-type phosphatase domain-containing protein n=1 Tax=Algibacter mikhailovii TaxID=425498 RepID=A0A918VBJ0_9FLAO|nr:protein phosphatase 2C domain-containing protein [Algibacter mikhailovii]GGZ85717.1 hypothetical protein GCM10007028_24980 [Algibacter mikhailovii]
MKILSIHKRSSHHPHFSEDFFYSFQLTDDIFVCAVMDGCSSAKDSQFTSVLYSKSIHKSCRMLPQMKAIIEDFDLSTMALEDVADFILNQLFDDLKKTKKLFFLTTEELLSTVNLLIYNTKDLNACIKMSGDGLFAINGEITNIDQNNTPNFLGYHLSEKFDVIKDDVIQTWNFKNVNDVSISTDGIDKLIKATKSHEELTKLRHLFLVQPPTENGNLFLEDQFEALHKNGYILHDDLSIIRIVNK